VLYLFFLVISNLCSFPSSLIHLRMFLVNWVMFECFFFVVVVHLFTCAYIVWVISLPWMFLNSHLFVYLLSSCLCRIPASILCNVCLIYLVYAYLKSLSFSFNLYDNFARCSNLGLQLFLCLTFSTSLCTFLVFGISTKKSALS
jgi:hypothetical protein